MKQKQLSILAASLITAFAANVAFAGQIQSSSIQIAHEVIVSDAQSIKTPSVTYRFAGDVDATNNDQVFQVQLVLTGGGEWKTAGNAAAIVLVNNLGVAVLNTAYTVSTPAISADKKTLFATITLLQSGGLNLVTPAVRFNDAAGTAATVTKLYSVVGVVKDCTNTVPNLPFAFKHFTSVSSTNIADGVNNGIADEHTRSGNTSNGTLYTFPTNISLTVAASADGSAKINSATQTGFLGTAGSDALVADTYLSASLVNLGSVTLNQDSNGYDADGATQYLLATPGVGGAAATATLDDGTVEQKYLKVTVTGSQGFQNGGTLFLSTGLTCAASVGGTGSVLMNSAALASAPVNLLLNVPAGATAYSVCYQAAGANVIPSSTFSTVATLVKAPDFTADTYKYEQPESCKGDLYPLSGGVKIDVRNYATSKTSGGWMSVIRVINPSEINTATVYGQLIHADGSYGGWGTLGTLAPRAVFNMTSSDIDAKLSTASASNGAGYVSGAVAPAASSVGDRLRITADGVTSLRVQNYLYNPDSKNFIEASSTQGVDFDSLVDRAPSDAQAVTQDAQRGLAK
ncbi:MAG: hypothetical protein Q7T62_11335 [Undibacterium sp.]|nr:hypothetical protein [Undibacterium sp.]